jgi:hypothetical protein
METFQNHLIFKKNSFKSSLFGEILLGKEKKGCLGLKCNSAFGTTK